MRDRLRRAQYWLIAWGGVNRVSAWLHPLLYRWTGGRGPLGSLLGIQIVLMTTTGARTGKPRTIPIWAYLDGSDWVVVASRGGDPRLPAWYFNLRSDARASLQIGRRDLAVRAREASGGSSEYDRLWALVNDAYPGYRYYRQKAGRHLPIVVLEPA